jgi:hypothetical protein
MQKKRFAHLGIFENFGAAIVEYDQVKFLRPSQFARLAR